MGGGISTRSVQHETVRRTLSFPGVYFRAQFKMHCSSHNSEMLNLNLQMSRFIDLLIAEGVVPLVGTGSLSHMAWGTSCFIFFYWYCVVWANFWPLQKLKKPAICFLPGLSSLKRDVWVTQSKMARPKVSGQRLLDIFTKNAAFLIFLFRLFSFVSKKSHVDPQKHCFWDGMNLGR